jgi:hypothetical protein
VLAQDAQLGPGRRAPPLAPGLNVALWDYSDAAPTSAGGGTDVIQPPRYWLSPRALLSAMSTSDPADVLACQSRLPGGHEAVAFLNTSTGSAHTVTFDPGAPLSGLPGPAPAGAPSSHRWRECATSCLAREICGIRLRNFTLNSHTEIISAVYHVSHVSSAVSFHVRLLAFSPRLFAQIS